MTDPTTKMIGSDTDSISFKGIIIKIREWLYFLKTKWILIIICFLVGGIAGFGYAYYKKPVFHAFTTFVLEDAGKAGGIGQYSGLASMVGIDIGSGVGGIFQSDNIVELYKSRAMIQKTLLTSVSKGNRKDLLINFYIEHKNFKNDWEKNPTLRNLKFESGKSLSEQRPFTRDQDSLIGVFVANINKENLVVDKLDKKLNILKVEVKSTDEFFAKNFDEQIVKNVNDFYVKTKIKKSSESVGILQYKTDSVRAVLNGAIYRAAAVSDATPNLNITRQAQRSVPIQRSQITAEENRAILGEILKNLELSKIALLKETPLIQVIDSPIYPLEKVSFSKLKAFILGGLIITFIYIMFLLIGYGMKDIFS